MGFERFGFPLGQKLGQPLGAPGGGSAVASPPSAPTITAPTNGGTVSTLQPQITWNAVAGAATYEIEYGTTLTGTPTVTGLAGTSYNIPSNLLNFTGYSVQMWARNAAGLSPASTTVTFTPKVYTLQDEFTTSLAAGSVNGTTSEPGGQTRNVTDGANKLSIATAKLTVVGRNANNDPRLTYASQSRAAGLAMRVQANYTVARGSIGFNNGVAPGGTPLLGIGDTSGTLRPQIQGTGISGLSWSTATDLDLAFVCRANGGFVFQNISGTWTLIWSDTNGSTATLFPGYWALTTDFQMTSDYIRVGQLPAPFTTDYGIASVNVTTPVSGSWNVAQADGFFHFDFTLPGSPSAGDRGAELQYRGDGANNYWVAYIKRNAGNTAWDMLIDSVASGTPTNRLTVTGVGTPDGLRIRANGNLHDAWTRTGTTFTKQGAQVNNAALATQTQENATYIAGTTATRLSSFPLTNAAYAILGAL